MIEIRDLKKEIESHKADSAEAKKLQEKYGEMEQDLLSKAKEMDTLKSNLAKLEDKLSKLNSTKADDAPQTFASAFEAAINSDEFKAGAKAVLDNDRQSFSMELKNVTLSTVTAPVSLTSMRAGLDTIPQGETPLYNLAMKRNVPADKNRIGYLDADFVGNGGYVAEMAALIAADKSSLSASEKYVSLTKLGTYMPYTQEFYKDNSSILTWGQGEALTALMLIIEGELLDGVGDDSTNADKIRGLDKYSTAFDTDIVNTQTENPTYVDLIKAMKLQIRKQSVGKYQPTHVLMSTDDVLEIEAAKDSNKNPLQYRNVVINADGTMRIAGLTVIESLTLDPGTLYVITQRVWELYSKAGFVVEVERVHSTDSYILYIRWRGQALITDKGKLGIVKATSANLADIEKDSAPIDVNVVSMPAEE